VVEARPQSLDSADRIGVNAARTPQDVERSARASEQMLVGADVLDATRQSSDSFDHAQGDAAVVRTAGAMAGALDERPPQSRRIGGQSDRRRVLRRELTDRGDHDSFGRRREDDSDDELPRALGGMVLSDGEVGDANVPARVRRVLRRSASDVSRGDVDEVLAARMGRSMPDVEGVAQRMASVGVVADEDGGAEPASIAATTAPAVEPSRGGSARVSGDVVVQDGRDTGRRRSARIEAHSRAAVTGQGNGREVGTSSTRAGRGGSKGGSSAKGSGKRGRG